MALQQYLCDAGFVEVTVEEKEESRKVISQWYGRRATEGREARRRARKEGNGSEAASEGRESKRR